MANIQVISERAQRFGGLNLILQRRFKDEVQQGGRKGRKV